MNEEIQVQFDRYYEGSMSADEKSTFSARLESDTEWKNQYQDYLNAREILEIRAEQDLRDNLKNLESNTKSTGFNKFWILATVITATLIMLLAIWKETSDINPQQIADEFGVSAHIDDMRSLRKSDPLDPAEQDYLNKIAKAKEYLDAQKYDLARQMYAQVSDENKVIRENKEWLIALSHYLEEGRNHAGFQSTLDRILREPDHNCYNLAVQVDDRVNSFWGRLKG